ncbi:hypothetical protein QTP88_000595 [Uroleucon formosanum]
MSENTISRSSNIVFGQEHRREPIAASRLLKTDLRLIYNDKMVSNLISRRGQLKGNLTRFWNYVSATDNDPKQINVRRSKIEDAWEEFHQVQLFV